MREVAQSCRACGARFHLPVDAWSNRPGLEGLSECPRCASGDRPPSSQRASIAPMLFFLFAAVCVVTGIFEAVSLG